MDLSQFNFNEFVDPTVIQDSNVDADARMAQNAKLLDSMLASSVASAPTSDATPAQLDLQGSKMKGSPVGGNLGKFLHAIATQESGGRYNALGVVTRSGDRAYGKYQIMGANIPSWSEAALGRSLTPQQFLHSPKAQEAVARYKLTQYFKRYGAAGAAKAWYAGEGNARTNSDSPQYGGPSINDYAAQVLRRM